MTDLERQQMDANDLYMSLGAFIGDNSSHHLVERRWLAVMAKQLQNIALGLKTGGVSTLSEHYQQSIKDFRLGEIQLEQNKLDRAQKTLADEAEKLQNKAA